MINWHAVLKDIYRIIVHENASVDFREVTSGRRSHTKNCDSFRSI